MLKHKAAWPLLAFALAFSAASARAETPGITDTEIKIGQNAAFSGPASVYGQISTAETHYFEKINAEGGINGRKITLIALDDGYSPPKAIEVIRKLVEDEQVAILFQTLGTASNVAIRKYVNQKKVPDIWIGSGASVFSASSKDFPWTIQFQPSYRVEGAMYAKYILATRPDAKIGILYQNDDLGRDYIAGLKDGLGDKFDKMVVKNISYEITDPTIDSQIVELRGSGADVVFDASTPKFSAMTIRKIADIDWHPCTSSTPTAHSCQPALQSAGFDKSVGVITAQYLKDPTDPAMGRRRRDAGVPGLESKIRARGRYREPGLVLRLHDGPGVGGRSEAGRQGPDAGKHHERGNPPARHDETAAGTAGDQDLHFTQPITRR
jgi:branched-chain amino acid transport system substrate-binding protein